MALYVLIESYGKNIFETDWKKLETKKIKKKSIV